MSPANAGRLTGVQARFAGVESEKSEKSEKSLIQEELFNAKALRREERN